MKVFIWTDLQGTDAGIAMAIARDEEEARRVLLAERPMSPADAINLSGHRALEYDLAGFWLFI